MVMLQTMSQLGEFIGGIGVIFTLIYFAVQVRSNTASQRADMTARLLERFSAQQHIFGFDEQANSFFMRSVTDPTTLTMEEGSQFQWVMTEFLISMEFLMQQYEIGNIDQAVWTRWQQTLDFWLSFPGVKIYWACRATPYTERFTSHVENSLASNNYNCNVANYRSFMFTAKMPDQNERAMRV